MDMRYLLVLVLLAGAAVQTARAANSTPSVSTSAPSYFDHKHRRHPVTSRDTVTVSKAGGDYADPVTAAANAFTGDAWCSAPKSNRPCVMRIGTGIFFLHETLTIPEGLVVSGTEKGVTMLVADIGVETAVSTFGNVLINDLTIINSQTGGPRTTGILASGPDSSSSSAPLAQLLSVAIHVAGATQNVAVVQNVSLRIVDAEITAVGQDTSGIYSGPGPESGASVTLERSRVSAEVAVDKVNSSNHGPLRLIDSYISGNVLFNYESSLLEIIGSEIVGSVWATNDAVRVVMTDATIKGGVSTNAFTSGADLLMTNTIVEGTLTAGHNQVNFDGLRVLGEFVLDHAQASVLRSYIASTGTTAALSLRSSNVRLEQSFVQGALVAQNPGPGSSQSSMQSSSSVLAGTVEGAASAVLNCSDTFGADYELLSASCQPQASPTP